VFITTIFIPFIILFDYFVIRTGLSKFLLDKIKQLSLSFGDVILLLILFSVAGIYVWVFLLNKKVNSISKENISEVLNKNRDLIRIIDDLRDTCNKILSYQEIIIKENIKLKSEVEKIESAEPNLEIFLILESLANESDKCLEVDEIWNLHYKKRFKNQELSDFQIVINELKEKNSIREFEGGEWDKPYLEITSEGLKYLKVLKDKLERPL